MTRRVTLSALFLSILPLTACGDEGECVCPASLTLNVGHRGSGDSSLENPLPENTLPSIQAAMADGADGVEIDVQLSADGVLVLMHDFVVDHTTDGTGCVSALTVDELKALDAGNPGALGEGVQVPTFAEVLESFDAGILDVELKVAVGNELCGDTDRAATVAAFLADLGDFPRERLVVSSFDAEILSLLRAEDDTIPVAYLALSSSALDVAEAEGFDAAALLALSVTPALVDEAHARGISVWVWTLDDPVLAAELIDAGVDGVITNDVPAIGSVKAELCEGLSC